MEKPSILFLVVKKSPFDVMITGEKKEEYRMPTKWIQSRLIDKQNNKKHYDLVCIIHAYGKNAPRFYAIYKGFYINKEQRKKEWSNGFGITVSIGDIVIELGDIIHKKDINNYTLSKKQMALEF